MLTAEERIKIRDKLFVILKSRSLIFWSNKFGKYVFPPIKTKFQRELNLDSNLSEQYNLYISQFRSENEALYCLTHNDDFSNHMCLFCNSRLCEFYEKKLIYKKTCNGKECIQGMIHSEKARKRYEETNFKKYGVKYILQSQEGKEKFKSTCQGRYGADYPAQNEAIYSKVKQTNLERYGDTCSSRNEEVKQKLFQTNMERYGNETIFGSTFFKKTMISKYSVEIYTQRNISNYEIWIDKDKFSNFIINQYNEKGMFLTLSDVCGFFNVWPDTLHKKVKKLNLDKYFQIKDSSLEVKFIDAMKRYGIEIQDKNRHNKSIILNEETGKYFEIDIILPNSNIGIEINDIASHNSLNIKHKTYKPMYYHYMKTEKAKLNGIRLIHIWEWEIRNSNIWNRVSRWILNLFNTNKVDIDIDNTIVKVIDDIDTIKGFLEDNSLDGYKESDIVLGLYNNKDDDTLLQLISFVRDKDSIYRIVNISTNYSYKESIYGYKKILDYFISNYIPNTLISSPIDLSKEYSNDIYKVLGFKLSNIIEPSIVWCNKDMEYFISESINDDYDKYLEEGYIPIYNCGYKVYKYR